MSKEHILAIVDLGSSKIVGLIAAISEEKIQVIGVSTLPSKGIKKGVVVDIDEAVESVHEVVKSAERMAGVSISRVWVTINGHHIASVNSQGVVAVASNEGEIQATDVERVTEAARAISLPSSREIIHVIPRTFIVDSQEGIDDPIGMSGVRLQVETHIITGASTSMRNLVKCIQQVGLDVENLIFAGLASSESVINETEKELGVVLVDIGGGTTDVVILVDGSPVYSSVLKLGGKNITADIAIGLRVSMDEAEEIKKFVSLKQRPVATPVRNVDKSKEKTDTKANDEIDISSLGLESIQTVDRKFLVGGIIQPRLEEIADEILQEIKRSGHSDMTPAGIVVCGGAAQTIQMKEVLANVSDLPVRIGEPTGVSGLIDEITDPAYSASIGGLIYASTASVSSSSLIRGLKLPIPNLKAVWEKTKGIVKGFMP